MIGKTNAVARGGKTNPAIVCSPTTSSGPKLRLQNIALGSSKSITEYYVSNTVSIAEGGYRVTDNGIDCFYIEDPDASRSPSLPWTVRTKTYSGTYKYFSDADIDITMAGVYNYTTYDYLHSFMTPGKYRGQVAGEYILNEIWVDFEITMTSGSVGYIKLIGVVCDIDSLKAQLREGLLIYPDYAGSCRLLDIPLNTIEKIA